MCTNYRPTSREVALSWFGITLPDEAWPPESWPGYLAPLARRTLERADYAREGLLGRFGLIPHWARDADIGRRTYNARSETVDEKPSFRDAWRRGQRCIVPVQSFFEPSWETGKAVRWRIEHAEGEPLGVAGLWAEWRAPNGLVVPSFTMLTLNADTHALMKRFHRPGEEKRMLALLAPTDYDAWLAGTPAEAERLIAPYPADQLHSEAEPLPPRKPREPR